MKYIELPGFNLERTLFCGQTFRWEKIGSCYKGVVGNKIVTVSYSGSLACLDCDAEDLPYWENYFDARTNYAEIVRMFSRDKLLRKACIHSAGIRVLRQEPFETLISFIISQNNNIPRITKIIRSLCGNFGEEIEKGAFAFPTAERLAGLTETDISVIRAGFRGRYVIETAKAVANGEFDINEPFGLTADDAKTKLKKLLGVGDKVADCVLLFAYGKSGSVPKDVWIKRVMEQFYPCGLPKCVGEYGGIAQQFLFDYIRTSEKRELHSKSA